MRLDEHADQPAALRLDAAPDDEEPGAVARSIGTSATATGIGFAHTERPQIWHRRG
ncbi:MAG TPA: hypothetical protein VK698_24190 [Kofleriaceae bacterium]|nr:hypothetical protein [Kofleriaceae bacterium]